MTSKRVLLTMLIFSAAVVLCTNIVTAELVTIANFTDFNAANPGPEMPLTDGRQAGFFTQASGGGGDTMAGWTWYTHLSAVNTITVPLNTGTAVVGEQEIRNGTNMEINSSGPTSHFNLRHGVANQANALRKTYCGVEAGTATVDWSANTLGGLLGYFSQDEGATWTALVDAQDFSVTAGTLDILFVSNNGTDSSTSGNQGISDVLVSYPTVRTVDFTDFDAADPGPEMPLTDGRRAGFFTQVNGDGGDTMAGWTWYTHLSAINTISVPFGTGTAVIGEQEIRNGVNMELNSGGPTSHFNLRHGVTNQPIALRKTYSGVDAGTAFVDWVDNTLGGLKAYYSQDDGASWTVISDALDFPVTAGTLDILFVGNDGAECAGADNSGIQAVTVAYPTAVPEPGTFFLLFLGGLMTVVFSRRRR